MTRTTTPKDFMRWRRRQEAQPPRVFAYIDAPLPWAKFQEAGTMATIRVETAWRARHTTATGAWR